MLFAIICLISVWFICYSGYIKKYYAYNEFYKQDVVNYINNSISLSVILIVLAQLFLPVNFIWSLFRIGNKQQILK
jgi:hypothetical protein